MNIVADIVMFAWPVVVIGLFCCLPPRRAVIAAFLFAWLFLPMSSYALPLIPDYTKMTATSLSVLLGLLLFDSGRLATLKLDLVDVPMAIFCGTPFISSLVNDLGVWDGTSAVVGRFLEWGLPYLIGRLYFTDQAGLRELAIGVFISGLVYMPFCWFEMRMSPQLAQQVYGDSGRWYNAVRFGGYRPRVFMQDGLMVAAWMTTASLVGIVLWRTKILPRLCDLPTSLWVGLLVATTVLCRSTGALVLLAMGIGCFWFTRLFGTRIALVGLLLIAPTYIAVRVSGTWDGSQIIELAESIDEDRAGSMQFRLDNEDILIDKALQSPVFGWGGWGRSRVYDEWDNDISVPDGLWVQILGANGAIGLAALYAALLAPCCYCVFSFRNTSEFVSSPAAPLAIIAILHAIDSLPNSMENPIFLVVIGAMANANAIAGSARDGAEHVAIMPSPRPRLPWPRRSQAT